MHSCNTSRISGALTALVAGRLTLWSPRLGSYLSELALLRVRSIPTRYDLVLDQIALWSLRIAIAERDMTLQRVHSLGSRPLVLPSRGGREPGRVGTGRQTGRQTG